MKKIKTSLEIESEANTHYYHWDRYSSTRKKYLQWVCLLVAATACSYLVWGLRSLTFSGTISHATNATTGTIEILSTTGNSNPVQEATMPLNEWSEGHCDNSVHCYRNRSSMELEFGSTVQFIFTMGLEGTGHHWMGSIVKNSPTVQRLKQFQVWPDLAKQFQFHLFRRYKKNDPVPPTGLFNAHCVSDETTANDPSTLQESLVSQMKKIEAQANAVLLQQQQQQQQQGNETTYSTIPFPVNTIELTLTRFGEISYPNYGGPCRPLCYPDLNLLYDACHQAKVDCFQVYLYRHPVEILNSVVSRGYSPNDTSSMQLYTTDLQVLGSQLRNHANKTLGCFGFFEQNNEESTSATSATDTWKEAQLDLWNWREDARNYSNFLKEQYQPPSTSKTSLNAIALDAWLNDEESGPYLKSWWRLHNHVIAMCKRAVLGEKVREFIVKENP